MGRPTGAAVWERDRRSSRLTTFLGGVAGVAATLVLCGTGIASATSLASESAESAMSTRLDHARVVPYPMAQVWPTALRYLRVDRGYTLVDRDAEAGYVLFDFPIGEGSSDREEETRVGRGSLELLATEDASGRPSVKVHVSTDAGPTHLPHAIAEGLAAKLKRERGQPAPPPPRSPGPGPSPKEPAPPPADDPDDGSLPTLPPAVDPSEL
jgi:hypothetical protein